MKKSPQPEQLQKQLKPKKKWAPMRVTRVKLDATQAVFSCCDSSTKVAVEGGGLGQQCWLGGSCSPAGTGSTATSS